MSILKNRRKLSALEYEKNYLEFYDYMTDRIGRLPRRYQNMLALPMREDLNRIYDEVAAISEMYVEKDPGAERRKLCRETIKDLERFGAWLCLLWALSEGENGIKTITDRQKEYMAGMLNRELRLLAGVGKTERPTEMQIFDRKSKEKLEALRKLRELAQTVYPKVIRIPLAQRDEEAALACRYIRDAYYSAYTANGIHVENQKNYAKRRKLVGEAISDLYRLDRPMIKMFMVGLFSGKDMEKITFLINDSTKLLQALQKSDAERYAGLIQ